MFTQQAKDWASIYGYIYFFLATSHEEENTFINICKDVFGQNRVCLTIDRFVTINVYS